MSQRCQIIAILHHQRTDDAPQPHQASLGTQGTLIVGQWVSAHFWPQTALQGFPSPDHHRTTGGSGLTGSSGLPGCLAASQDGNTKAILVCFLLSGEVETNPGSAQCFTPAGLKVRPGVGIIQLNVERLLSEADAMKVWIDPTCDDMLVSFDKGMWISDYQESKFRVVSPSQ